jgi:hypothetical protein
MTSGSMSGNEMKVVVSCVAEDTPKWAERVRMLAFSLRRFGDGMADVPLIAISSIQLNARKTVISRHWGSR